MSPETSIPTTSREDTSLAFFRSVNWIDRALQDANFSIRLLSWNIDATSETLFGHTFSTPSTISHFCILTPISPPASPTPATETEGRRPLPEEVPSEMLGLLHLGHDMASHAGICHGGVLATILDEILGTLAFLRVKRKNPESRGSVTANLNVDYVKPVGVPGAVMVKARVVREDGRKVYVDGEIVAIPYGAPSGGEGEDQDGEGREEVCTKGRGLFVKLRD